MEISRHRFMNTAAVLVLTFTSAGVLTGRTIYVDPCAPGSSVGSTWTHAHVCLQNALLEAQRGDEIRVAQGLYMPDRLKPTHSGRGGSSRPIASGSRTDSFVLPDGVAMKGGYAGYGAPDPDARDVKTHPSILSGDLQGNDPSLTDLEWETLAQFTMNPNLADNSFTVVTINDASERTVLDGFTITAGHCEGGQPYQEPRGVIWPSPDPNTNGAGAWISSGQPTLIRCTFYRNTTRSLEGTSSGGAAVFNDNSDATFWDCSFEENIAFGYNGTSMGGAVCNLTSDPKLANCAFTNNIAASTTYYNVGGAMANFDSDPHLVSCSFTVNRAIDAQGGAIFNDATSDVEGASCTFEGNSALLGGAIYNSAGTNCTLSGCVFLGNNVNLSVRDSAFYDNNGEESGLPVLQRASKEGGAVYGGEGSATTITNCSFVGNTATNTANGSTTGGAVYSDGQLFLANCLLSGNGALNGAAVYALTESSSPAAASPPPYVSVINCTFSANGYPYCNSIVVGLGESMSLTNCILWDEARKEVSTSGEGPPVEVVYCDVRGGYAGEGNIDADPGFQDPNGADGIAGTMDDDLRLSVDSPCLDAGDNLALFSIPATDLAGQPRLGGNLIDMGAYEFHGPFNYYVDNVNGDDTNRGTTRATAFATIQKAIDTARNGANVMVAPGIYAESISFSGKAITVTGSGGAPVIEAWNDYAVSFYSAEGPSSVLKNFVIRNSAMGIFLAGGSPTLRNLTLVDNEFGIAAYAGSNPDIRNCILWGNTAGDLFACTARFSCIEQGAQGEGNISEDPLFADPADGDYHLLSEGGRYVPAYGLWAFDTVTSPCVDAGDPSLDPGAERIPNGGRINMGAFGGTPQASLSLCVPCLGQ